MSAEIFDLRSKVGREAYLNHLKRKAAARSPSENTFDTAVFDLQTLAIQRMIEWMRLYYNNTLGDAPFPPHEDVLEFQASLVRQLLQTALETLSFDNSEVEKFMGPDWGDKL